MGKAPPFTPEALRICEPGSNFQKGKLFLRPEGSERLVAVVSSDLRFLEQRGYARLFAAAKDLQEALAGDDPEMPEHLRPIEWLHTLLELCVKPEVRAIIDGDDPDAASTMLSELCALVTNGRAALAKAAGRSAATS